MKRSISQREAARTLEDDRSVRGWTAAWMMLLSLLALSALQREGGLRALEVLRLRYGLTSQPQT